MDKNKFKELQKVLSGLSQTPIPIPSETLSPIPGPIPSEKDIISPELQINQEDISLGGYETPTEMDEELKKKVLQRLIEKQNQKLNFVPGEN